MRPCHVAGVASEYLDILLPLAYSSLLTPYLFQIGALAGNGFEFL